MLPNDGALMQRPPTFCPMISTAQTLQEGCLPKTLGTSDITSTISPTSTLVGDIGSVYP